MTIFSPIFQVIEVLIWYVTPGFQWMIFLFLTQDCQMAIEDLKSSAQAIWTILWYFFCHFWSLWPTLTYTVWWRTVWTSCQTSSLAVFRQKTWWWENEVLFEWTVPLIKEKWPNVSSIEVLDLWDLVSNWSSTALSRSIKSMSLFSRDVSVCRLRSWLPLVALPTRSVFGSFSSSDIKSHLDGGMFFTERFLLVDG